MYKLLFNSGATCFLIGLMHLLTPFEDAWSYDQKGNFSVRGVGVMKCGQAVELAKSGAPELVALVAWSEGALSATNRLKKGVYDVLPFDVPPGIFTTLVVNYCQQRPDEMYDTALANVIEILKPVTLEVESKPQTIRSGEASATVYPETLKKVQQKLISLGYMSGQADGKFGNATRDAVMAFQKAKGKPQTGLPEVDTILTLLLDN